MHSGIKISLDGMGGDSAPEIVVEGASIALRKYPEAKFIIFGDKEKIAPLVEKHRELSSAVEIRHTPDKISSDDKPSVALRAGRNSSMRLAIDAVANGDAQGVVSAGNTGALMAISKFVLKVLPGITRPAIATYMPTKKADKKVVMLDLGANVDCDAQMLLEFGVLGGVFSREVLKIQNPKIGILNIGSEALKGNNNVKEAAELFENANHIPGEYIGFVEGDDIGSGEVDVVVTDGFTGNVSLKTMEGTAKLIVSIIKSIFTSSVFGKVALILFVPGLLLVLPSIFRVKKRIDPRSYNGASLLGLRGLCVKSHGGTDSIGFANAIGAAIEMAKNDFNEVVAREIEMINVGGETVVLAEDDNN